MQNEHCHQDGRRPHPPSRSDPPQPHLALPCACLAGSPGHPHLCPQPAMHVPNYSAQCSMSLSLPCMGASVRHIVALILHEVPCSFPTVGSGGFIWNKGIDLSWRADPYYRLTSPPPLVPIPSAMLASASSEGYGTDVGGTAGKEGIPCMPSICSTTWSVGSLRHSDMQLDLLTCCRKHTVVFIGQLHAAASQTIKPCMRPHMQSFCGLNSTYHAVVHPAGLLLLWLRSEAC